jgi:hypothetical protein
MQEPILELRKRGIPLSDYIDDTFTAARTYLWCLRQSALGGRFFSALGAFFGLPKCHFEPVQLLRWLGFMVDTQKQEFRLGESKVGKLKQTLKDAVAEPKTTPRKLAVMAGRIIAASPAVLPAALYSRALFEAMQGQVSWDEIFPSPESVRETANFWLNNINRFNGRRWWPRATSVSVRVDASEVGYGGWIEVAGKESIPFSRIFTERQAEFSSTEREVIGYVAGLAVATQQFPAELTDKSVLVLVDNQGGISAINRMRSSVPMICSALKKALELCAALNFDITARWIPREENEAADALSRELDASDWGIEKGLLQKLISRFRVRIMIDMYASDAHHVSDNYVLQYYTPGCFAVHAPKQDWSKLLERAGADVAWVFPPVRCAGQALSLIARYRIRALVCICSKQGSLEMVEMQKFREWGAKVSEGYGIPKAASCYLPSLRVPPDVVNPAFMGLTVYHIDWE